MTDGIKIKITCPDCYRSETFLISKTRDAYWQHDCSLHGKLLNIMVSVIGDKS